jgi:hypothetical protein
MEYPSCAGTHFRQRRESAFQNYCGRFLKFFGLKAAFALSAALENVPPQNCFELNPF